MHNNNEAIHPAGAGGMKAYFIFHGPARGHEKMISMLSAFAQIECIGISEDILDAIDVIRQWYPDAALFSGRVFEEAHARAALRKNNKAVVILPGDCEQKGKCTYLGVDFPVDEGRNHDWVIRSFGHMLREYHNVK